MTQADSTSGSPGRVFLFARRKGGSETSRRFWLSFRTTTTTFTSVRGSTRKTLFGKELYGKEIRRRFVPKTADI